MYTGTRCFTGPEGERALEKSKQIVTTVLLIFGF
jgi:hypothetical protein